MHPLWPSDLRFGLRIRVPDWQGPIAFDPNEARPHVVAVSILASRFGHTSVAGTTQSSLSGADGAGPGADDLRLDDLTRVTPVSAPVVVDRTGS